MSHHCKTLILHCIDFRFGKAIKNYLEENNLLGNTDIVSVAGAVKDLVEPENPSDADFIIRQINISARLHNISEVILMNHMDCGAYGGHAAFDNDDTEYDRHIQDLERASDIIRTAYPQLKVKTILAHILPDKNIDFEEIEITKIKKMERANT